MGDGCAETCSENPYCGVWQYVKDTDSCWQGVGYDCYSQEGDRQLIPGGAQRLMHGECRLLKDFAGWQIEGLRHVDSGYGDANDKNNQTLAIENCKKVCYSNIRCQYWSFSKDEAGNGGCWLEDPEGGYTVKYPLTTANALKSSSDSDFASTVIAGEYIQHL